MKQFFLSIFLTERWFLSLGTFMVLFVVGYFYPPIFSITKYLFYFFAILTLVEIILLYFTKSEVKSVRETADKLSNGDENPISILVQNYYPFRTHIRLIDEIPDQFQKRDFNIQFKLEKNAAKTVEYFLRPVERGAYYFHRIRVFVKTDLGLIERRFSHTQEQMVPTYPSYLQLRKYSLMAMSNRLYEYGLKKIRRIGHTMEFEQIKDYVLGDDIRNINWKATAKRSKLMVNQFQDEKAQPVYSVIDMGRVMELPFEGMSLLDYAINSTLVISNIALLKQDKAGMFTFDRKVENVIAAERRPSQMNLILEKLYALETDFAESDFMRLYTDTKRILNQRSLLLLYTNFETMDALNRQLPYLQAMAKNHLLVVIFFDNTELKELATSEAENTFEIFEKTIAEKFVYEKKLIVKELNKHGIQTILTTPQDLTVATINKYLEIKARGLI